MSTTTPGATGYAFVLRLHKTFYYVYSTKFSCRCTLPLKMEVKGTPHVNWEMQARKYEVRVRKDSLFDVSPQWHIVLN